MNHAVNSPVRRFRRYCRGVMPVSTHNVEIGKEPSVPMISLGNFF